MGCRGAGLTAIDPSPAQPSLSVPWACTYMDIHYMRERPSALCIGVPAQAQTGKWAERGLGDRGSQAGGFKELLDQSASHC